MMTKPAQQENLYPAQQAGEAGSGRTRTGQGCSPRPAEPPSWLSFDRLAIDAAEARLHLDPAGVVLGPLRAAEVASDVLVAACVVLDLPTPARPAKSLPARAGVACGPLGAPPRCSRWAPAVRGRSRSAVVKYQRPGVKSVGSARSVVSAAKSASAAAAAVASVLSRYPPEMSLLVGSKTTKGIGLPSPHAELNPVVTGVTRPAEVDHSGH